MEGVYDLIDEPVAPHGPIAHPPIKKPRAAELTRDQKRDIKLLHDIGWSYGQIHDQFGYTVRQIGKACTQQATPRKKGNVGAKPALTQAQIEELVEFVCASSKNRRMSYAQLAEVLEFGVKRDAIRNALLREGFHRRLAMRKPPITEKNRQPY